MKADEYSLSKRHNEQLMQLQQRAQARRAQLEQQAGQRKRRWKECVSNQRMKESIAYIAGMMMLKAVLNIRHVGLGKPHMIKIEALTQPFTYA